MLALGDAHGDVHLVPRSLRLHSFRAHADGVSHVQLLRGGSWLATVGVERDGSPTRATFKLWRLARAGSPVELAATCVRIAKVFASADVEVGVTALCVSECLTLAALGLRSGDVLLAHTAAHDLSRERALAFRLCARAPAPSCAEPALGSAGEDGARTNGAGSGAPPGSAAVNALFFSSLCAVSDEPGASAPPEPSAAAPPAGLFVLSGSGVSSVNVARALPLLQQLGAQPQASPGAGVAGARGGGGSLAQALCSLDSSAGCARGCSALSPAGALAVARAEAIFLFGLEERGPCVAFGGPKLRVAFLVCGYLAVLSGGGLSEAAGGEEPARLGAGAGAAGGGGAARGAPEDDEGGELGGVHATLSIYDLKHKLVAHAQPAPGRARVLAGAWGGCALLGADGRAWRLRERSADSKLCALTARGQYELAVALASAHGCAAAEVGELRWKFALHLFSLGEPDGAAAQLAATVGSVPAARVVRFLLESAQIEPLAAYLEELHARGGGAAEGCGGAGGCDDAEGGDGAEGGSLLRPEHSSLLLTCYLQLGRRDKASALVSTDGFRLRSPLAARAEPQPGAAGGAASREVSRLPSRPLSPSTPPRASASAQRAALSPPAPSAAAAAAPAAPAAARASFAFDADTAIRLCRESGLLDEALEASERHGRYEAHLSLLLDELRPPRAARALSYIATLPRAHARAALRAHGKLLLEILPDRTTGLLMHHLSAQLAPGGPGADDAREEEAEAGAAELRVRARDAAGARRCGVFLRAQRTPS